MKYNPKVVLAFLSECRVPLPILEWRFDPVRAWRFDFAWPDSKLALEVQGGLFVRGAHVRGAALVREHNKRNAAAMQGWRILYVEPKDLCTMDTVNMIRECLK
jgi:hypothetical protein